jgi:uncharacterized protein (DUF2141 family)
MLKAYALLTAALLFGSQAIADDAGAVTITLHGLHNDEGTIACSLFDNSQAFPTQHALAVARTRVGAHMGDVACVFQAVRPGVYAIAGFHDENSNGKLDMGLLGPKEGWFASRNARGRFAPPSFANAKFIHKGGVLGLSANVVY